MRIVLKIINRGSIKDSYEYSDDLFIHNEDIIQVDKKDSKLLELISMTMDWKDNKEELLDDGFFISVDINNYHKEYKMNNSLPNNFMLFVYEIKKISMEGK